MAFQSDYRFTFKSQSGEVFDVIEYALEEGLSQLFNLQIELSRLNIDPVDFADLLDKPGTLTFWQGETPIRYVNGIITHFHQGGSGFRRTGYHAILEPAYARAALNSNCRIFQQRSVPEIIKIMLKENGIISHRLDLYHSHEKRSYTVQYRETDRAFIERLAAEEGIHYFFEHQEGQHTIVLSDDSRAAPNLGKLLYNPNRSASPTESSLWGVGYREKIATAEHRMRDYTFKNPAYSLEHGLTRPLEHQRQSYQKYDYPGRYKLDAQGKPFNQYRLEQERCDTQQAGAQSDHLQLIAGHRITLSEPPENSEHINWLIVSVRHTGAQPQSQLEDAGSGASRYQNEPRLIPLLQPWRPATEHKPRVDGPQMAHVVGPAGEEIYCDEYGRVKVQFPWDREGQKNEFSSCWIRVSQGWAGAGWGAVAVPRIGQEVIVDFLEGDPDQPIITGRTYQAVNMPPYGLPANKTRMTIKSKTHKGEGFNELRFEDEAGREEMFIHAQKDQNTVVKDNQTLVVENGNRSLAVQTGNESKVLAQGSLTEHIHKQRKTTANRVIVQANRGDIGPGLIQQTAQNEILLKVGASEIVMTPEGIKISHGNSSITLDAEKISEVADMIHLNSPPHSELARLFEAGDPMGMYEYAKENGLSAQDVDNLMKQQNPEWEMGSSQAWMDQKGLQRLTQAQTPGGIAFSPGGSSRPANGSDPDFGPVAGPGTSGSYTGTIYKKEKVVIKSPGGGSFSYYEQTPINPADHGELNRLCDAGDPKGMYDYAKKNELSASNIDELMKRHNSKWEMGSSQAWITKKGLENLT